MTAEIISVGTELLLGQIANTDAQFLSRKLAEAGIDVYRHSVVGDNLARVTGMISSALARCDLVITTGGLGPTQDDLTKEAVCQATGLPLVQHKPSLDAISAYFAASGRAMTPNNARQAMFPEGARVLPNRRGTAPGCWLELHGKVVLVLPGPPHELMDMYLQQAEPLVRKLSGELIISRVLRVFGIGESQMEQRLRTLIDAQKNTTIAPLFGEGDVTLRLTAKVKTQEEAEQLFAPVEKAIRDELGEHVYAVGEEGMSAVVARMLMDGGYTVAVAESLTGGMVAQKLIDHPGISKCFLSGIVAYANQAKINMLGVDAALLEQYGAVSPECALAMARGMKKVSGADFALSTTGIAGPGGGSEQKPVGLVYVALSGPMGDKVIRLQLSRGRERIRLMAAIHALNLLRKGILDYQGGDKP
nr:competence/damage-inducible protein A [bacterium]